MRGPLLLLSAALLAGAMSAPALAQQNPNTPYGRRHRYAERLDCYLDAHPDVSQALHKNPRLIDDQRFVANHPSLREYLEKHPHVRQALRRHPDRFMHRERRYEVSENLRQRHHDHDADAH